MVRPRVVAVGDAIVDVVTPPLRSLPRGDFQGEVDSFSLLPGGNATNFALQMGALGARASLVASVGEDSFADLLRSAYRHYGVDAHLVRDPQRATGTTVALTWADGHRALITALGANARLRERDVTTRVLDEADHVHRAGFWWTPALLGPPTVRILARAQRKGATTSLDISTDPRGWSPRRVQAVRECLPYVDTFFGNEAEVCAVAHRRDFLAAAKGVLRLGVKEVIVHRGSRGASSLSSDRAVHVPAYPVCVENPTGCGDVFNAGFVRAQLSGQGTLEALRFANACAALHLSDRSRPYPRLAAVRRFVRHPTV